MYSLYCSGADMLSSPKQNRMVYEVSAVFVRHKDEPEFKAYKNQHVKVYQEKTKEYYTNLRHVVDKLEELGLERIAEILIAHKKVKLLDSYDSINVSE